MFLTLQILNVDCYFEYKIARFVAVQFCKYTNFKPLLKINLFNISGN